VWHPSCCCHPSQNPKKKTLINNTPPRSKWVVVREKVIYQEEMLPQDVQWDGMPSNEQECKLVTVAIIL